VLLSIATGALLVAMLPGDQRPAGVPPLAACALAIAAIAGFLALERRHPEPLVPLDLFRDRVHVAANVAGVLLGVVLFGVVSYVPLYVQGVWGGTPIDAGATLIPLSFGWTGASIVAGRLVSRVGFQLLVRTGSALIALGAAVGAGGIYQGSEVLGILGLCFYGVGMGCCISSFTVSVQERVPIHRRGIATALTQFSRAIGGALGVAVLGALMLATVGGDPTSGDLAAMDASQREVLERGLLVVFGAGAAVALAAGAVGILLFPKVEEGMARGGPPREQETTARQ
jgi:MFS family permease